MLVSMFTLVVNSRKRKRREGISYGPIDETDRMRREYLDNKVWLCTCDLWYLTYAFDNNQMLDCWLCTCDFWYNQILSVVWTCSTMGCMHLWLLIHWVLYELVQICHVIVASMLSTVLYIVEWWYSTSKLLEIYLISNLLLLMFLK
jgi:hypothetical protein